MSRTDTHKLFRGLSIFKCPTSKFYHCRIFVGDNEHIICPTGEIAKIKAKKVANKPYLP